MVDPARTSSGVPSLLEQLGALSSLLIHDLANQMCIISGNATFAQMMLEDPQQLERAIEAINKSSERISFILGQGAELRRRWAGELPQGDAREAVGAVRALMADRPGWTLEVTDEPAGPLVVPTAWIRLAIAQVLAEAAVPHGKVHLRRMASTSDTIFLSSGTYFEARFSWESSRMFSIDELRARFENFGLLASYELIRQCGGRLEGFTAGDGRQETLLCIPFACGLAGRCSV